MNIISLQFLIRRSKERVPYFRDLRMTQKKREVPFESKGQLHGPCDPSRQFILPNQDKMSKRKPAG